MYIDYSRLSLEQLIDEYTNCSNVTSKKMIKQAIKKKEEQIKQFQEYQKKKDMEKFIREQLRAEEINNSKLRNENMVINNFINATKKDNKIDTSTNNKLMDRLNSEINFRNNGFDNSIESIIGIDNQECSGRNVY